MRFLRRLFAYLRIARKAKRNRTDAIKYLVRRPAIATAITAYEVAVMVSNRVDIRTKYLASMRASSLIGCPF
jgi:hypothetical protein